MEARILDQVNSPASYLGCEWGAARKPRLDGIVRWALAFPDTYEIGMSHLGIQILYHVLNRNPDSAAERVFTPRLDMQTLLKKEGIPLCSLETQTPLNEFDVVGFSLLYELCYTNVLKMFELGRIPIRAADRGQGDPLVIAGGPCVTNPGPLTPFFDAFALGEGEEVVLDINGAVREVKAGAQSGAPLREALLERLSKIEGVYVPAVHRRGSSDFEAHARKIVDLDNAPFPTHPVVPSIEATHDRAVVEIARGCPHACRFCHAGYLGRPHRERKPATVWKLACEILLNTGYQDLTLLSLSTGDYRCLPQLVAALSARFGCCGVSLNLPSLRADSLRAEVIEGIRGMRKTGVTIAPEAGSARLRAVINKDISEEEVLRTARLVFDNGWDLIKLYFMFGLPTETEHDLEEIGRLVRSIRKEGLRAGIKPRINVSLSAFVPKPHTPFQWEAMLDENEIQERLGTLRGILRIPGVNLKWSPPFMSVLEGLFARGDERLAPVIERAVSLGASFDAWGEGLKPQIWKRAFMEEQFDPKQFVSRHRNLDEPLPWSHIKTGVSIEWLANERERALRGEPTPGCEDSPCSDPCGACDREVEPIRFDKTDFEPAPARSREPRENFVRLRLAYSKTGPARYLGHLDTMRELQRSLRRAEIDILYSEGFHPKPRLSFGDALPVGVESLCEMLDVRVHKSQPQGEIPDRLNKTLAPGLKITAAREIPPDAPSIEASIRSVGFRFETGGQGEPARMKREEIISRFNEAEDFWIEKESVQPSNKVDLKSVVRKIEISDSGAVEMEFSVGKTKVKPRAAYEALFGPLPPGSRITKVATAVSDD